MKNPPLYGLLAGRIWKISGIVWTLIRTPAPPCFPTWDECASQWVFSCYGIHMFLRPKENDPKLWSPEKDMLQAGIEFLYRFIGDFEASDLPGAFNMAKPKNQGIIRDHGLHAPALVSCGNLESNPEMPGTLNYTGNTVAAFACKLESLLLFLRFDEPGFWLFQSERGT